jgi:hypothetical protein
MKELSVSKFMEMSVEAQIKYMNVLEDKLGINNTTEDRYKDISGYEQLYYINYLEDFWFNKGIR